MRNVSHESCRENRNTYFMFSTFVRKSCRLRDKVQRYGTARQATDDNIILGRKYVFFMRVDEENNTDTYAHNI